MRTIRICAVCSRELPAAERCSACHPGAAPTATPDPEWSECAPEPGDGAVFGRYKLGPRLGSGGMGVVHRARDLQVGRDVALKTLPGGQYASSLSLSLFQEEIRAFARLDHPYVVPIYEAGEHAGQLYFTMKLLPGDLKTGMDRFAGDPIETAMLVEKITLAVRHLHQHGILHRDLKPANILLDAADPPNPYVADFGVAKQLGEGGPVGSTGVVVGTPEYMAPEQAAGKSVTWAADVYSLGVILFELLARRLPFEGDPRELARAKQSPPRDLRVLGPRVDRDLARICLRCLEPEPEERYPSALALAVALRRYLNGEPFESAGRFVRAWRWCLRHSLTTGLLLAVLSFLVLVTSRVSTLLADQEVATREEIVQANMSGAAMVAGTVLAQIHSLSDSVIAAASQQEHALARAIEDDDIDALQAFCEATYAYHEGLKRKNRSPFNLWLIMDDQGALLAQYGNMGRPENLGRSYEWRDYFIGAKRLAEKGLHDTHVSRAFRSESDEKHKFAISTPIYSEDGRWRGVLVAAVASEPNLGSLVLDDSRSKHVLVAPRDRDRYYYPGSEFSYLILRHPAFVYGEAVEIESEQFHRVGALIPGDDLWRPDPARMAGIHDYHDPVAVTHPEYAGSWTAGFAPVGNTGFVVLTQTLAEQAVARETILTRQLVQWTILSAIPGALLVGFLAVYGRRRRRR